MKKRIRIEVRNARYALEQGASRVDAARHGRDLALAESALVTAETAYEKARIEVKRATGSILEEYGISIAEAKAGAVGADHLQ